MIFVVGGSGGFKSTDAILRVRATVGSTVTISKDGQSKSDSGRTSSLDPNYNFYYFIIHQNQFDSVNPWTITATLNGRTVTDTVIIDAAEEYTVTMIIPIFIIDSGVYTDETLTKYQGNSTETAGTGNIIYAMSDNNFTTWYSQTQIDITDYSTLTVKLTGGKFKYYARFGFRTTKTALSSQSVNIFDVACSIGSSSDITAISTDTTLTADISALTGSYWFGLTLEGSSSVSDTNYGKGGVKVTDIYLE